MKTIYTLTFHAADNYGAVWQAYALQTYLKNKGVITSCIDYRPAYFDNNIFSLGGKRIGIKTIVQLIITLPTKWLRKRAFKKFRKQNLQICSMNSVIQGADTGFLVGSDQVWNKSITGNVVDPFFTLENIISDNKYSYAASIGQETQERVTEVYDHLHCFKSIGVREKVTYDLLRKLDAHRIYWNIDPVFLLDKSDYTKFVSPIQNKPYVLVYTLETNYDVSNILKQYKRTHRVITIGSFKNIYGGDTHYRCASPEKFITLISSADTVISNSFHTISFSIIFGKKIVYIPLKNGRGGRIETLLSLLNASGNYCDTSTSDKSQLERLITDSKNYINSILG